MSNKQVAQNWREQTGKGRNGSNMYYTGRTIYSYGSHFPIAYITDYAYDNKKIILFNEDGYSNSTSKHKNHVYSVTYDDAIVRVSTNILKDMIYLLDDERGITARVMGEAEADIQGRLDIATAKMNRARSEGMVNMWKETIKNLELQLGIVATIPIVQLAPLSQYPF